MVSSKTCLLAFLAGAARARPTTGTTGTAAACAPAVPAAAFPLTGGATELPDPASLKLTLKKIAVGHGIQNYTCVSDSGTAVQVGALATLYDITWLYSILNNATLFDLIPSTLLWQQPIPLKLVDPGAAHPGTPAFPNALPEASYAAVVRDPYPAPAPATISLPSPPGSQTGQASFYRLPWLGRHYFDATSTPTFDLQEAGLRASVVKVETVAAPASAGNGIIGTPAVPWLYLADSGKGLSVGLSAVYRVETDGGSAQPCFASGAGDVSVPYSAMYWFYGT